MPSRQEALFVLWGADLQSTADQPFQRNGAFVNYKITRIDSICRSGGVTVSCLGGIYTGVNKSGSALVSAAQSWLGLSAAGKSLDVTLAGVVSTDIQTLAPILSLTTGSIAPALAD